MLQFKPDTDVALLNAMMHTIAHEGLVNEDFVKSRTIGYDDLKKNVAGYSPEAMAPVCGIPAETIKEVARLYAKARASMILWGMGISQHIRQRHAPADRVGHIPADRPSRPGDPSAARQNNVAGASDSGLIRVFPDYQRVDNAERAHRFEKL